MKPSTPNSLARRSVKIAGAFLVALASACGDPPPLAWRVPQQVFSQVLEGYDQNDLLYDAELANRFERAVASVRTLDVDYCSAEGRIALEHSGLDWLEEFPALESLTLRISDPEGLRILGDPNAAFVFAMPPHRVRLDQWPELAALEHLVIETNTEQPMELFSRAPRLVSLEIISNIGQDLTPFAACASLRELRISAGEGEIHRYARGMPRMYELERCTVLPAIDTLVLDGVDWSFDHSSLTQLPALRHLTADLPLGETPSAIESMTWLTTLTLVGGLPGGTESAVAAWRERLPETQVHIVREIE